MEFHTVLKFLMESCFCCLSITISQKWEIFIPKFQDTVLIDHIFSTSHRVQGKMFWVNVITKTLGWWRRSPWSQFFGNSFSFSRKTRDKKSVYCWKIIQLHNISLYLWENKFHPHIFFKRPIVRSNFQNTLFYVLPNMKPMSMMELIWRCQRTHDMSRPRTTLIIL